MGTNIIGEGFALEPEEAKQILSHSPDSLSVIRPFINGSDVNNRPDQSHSRYIIDFGNFSKDYAAAQFPECFEIVKERVKPLRDRSKRKAYRNKWWQFGEKAINLYKAISNFERVIVTALTSKYFYVSFQRKGMVFSHALGVFAFQSYPHFAILHSNIHEQWAWHVSSTMRSAGIRYTPSLAFETFPFPDKKNYQKLTEDDLYQIGKEYHESRRQLLLKIKISLTKTYNQFHNSNLKELSIADITKKSILNSKEFQKLYGKETVIFWKHFEKAEGLNAFNGAVKGIVKLRKIHKQMDEIVLRAYGWEDIDLAHNFYEVDYLPENDRVRFTISPEARKEILKRLLKLNHEIHEREKKGDISPERKTKKKKSRKIKNVDAPVQRNLF